MIGSSAGRSSGNPDKGRRTPQVARRTRVVFNPDKPTATNRKMLQPRFWYGVSSILLVTFIVLVVILL